MVSVVIPAYNAAATLGACLAALQKQTFPADQYEIIVVDDGSTDPTGEVAQAYGVRLIRQPNGGPAAARNRGARAAHGEMLLFTDADCEPVPDWIERMLAPFDEPDVVGAKGAYRTHQGELVARFVQLEYEDRYARMAHQDSVDFIDTYSAAYRRNVFLVNGGFDTLFPTASVEDQEFSFRLAHKGYRLVFAPEAIVYHHHNTSLGAYWRRKFGIGYWKALLLRWHPDRAIQDSHTPQVLKLQIGLAALLGLSLIVAPFWTLAGWAAVASAGLFMVTAAPFIVWLARRDPPVALAGTFLLALRALALGTGLVAGFLRFSGRFNARPAPIGGAARVIKRTMDVVGSAMALVLAAPFLALSALAIKLDTLGPVLFVQERAGKGGRPFRMVKLRTMVDGADGLLPGPVHPGNGSAPCPKYRDDPRVTRVGRFLRRTSLDEVPQFWNVLKGEMSLVGPRPEELRVVQQYSDWHRQRLAVKPGITGPMQVNGRADLELDDRVRLELDYIEGYSIWRDVLLLAKTVAAVISGDGAY